MPPRKMFLSTSYWLTLGNGSPELRRKLSTLFEIKRSAGALVENIGNKGKLVSDGHTDEDLSAVSLPVMQRMLGTNSTDFFTLLNQVISEVDSLLEVKESGAVDSLWNLNSKLNEFNTSEMYYVSEPLEIGDYVRIKQNSVYKVSKMNPKLSHKLKKEHESKKATNQQNKGTGLSRPKAKTTAPER